MDYYTEFQNSVYLHYLVDTIRLILLITLLFGEASEMIVLPPKDNMPVSRNR
jgi:hypothetical protein